MGETSPAKAQQAECLDAFVPHENGPSAKRRSRMRRSPRGKRIEISPRDIEIFRLLARYRYLRSTFLYAFFGGHRTRFVERLGHLFHEGYLGRPSQQWRFVDCRSMPAIYELERKGEERLHAQGFPSEPRSYLTRSGRAARQFGHELMIADVLASIELGVRADACLRYIDWREILEQAPDQTRALTNPLKIPIAPSVARNGFSRAVDAVIPDGLFGLEYTHGRNRSYRFFALEADRGTMPIARSDPSQSSFVRKLLAYRELVARGAFVAQLGLPTCLVLTVTTNEAHCHGIMRSLERVVGGKGSTLFLFKTYPMPKIGRAPTTPMPELLTTPWERVGHQSFRIDMP